MRRALVIAAAVFVGVLDSAAVVYAADPLSDAKKRYDAAMYAEALQLLDQIAAAPATSTAEVHQYRALCLLALGRTDAAERAMADIVAADPFFRLDPDTASPRVVSMFAATRRRLLPPAIRRGFADATSFSREGDRVRAGERFAEVLRLLDDPDFRADPGLADLALVATAFVELIHAQTRAPVAGTPVVAALLPARAVAAFEATPPPVVVATLPVVLGAGLTAVRPAPVTPAAVSPASPAVQAASTAAHVEPPALASAATSDFIPPVAVAQPLPLWVPPDARSAERTFEGAIVVAIDENGRVTGATRRRSIHPAYDPKVLDAARAWSFAPARLNGQPVKSEIEVAVRLNPPVKRP